LPKSIFRHKTLILGVSAGTQVPDSEVEFSTPRRNTNFHHFRKRVKVILTGDFLQFEKSCAKEPTVTRRVTRESEARHYQIPFEERGMLCPAAPSQKTNQESRNRRSSNETGCAVGFFALDVGSGREGNITY